MESLTKQRDIQFSPTQSFGAPVDFSGIATNLEMGDDFECDQAKLAVFLLADVEGVLELKYLSETNILIIYDIRVLTLDTIHQALHSVGFQLDYSLISKIKNALYAYTEDTLRENLGIQSSKSTQEIFTQGYQQRLHGCRDPRSQYWRRYL